MKLNKTICLTIEQEKSISEFCKTKGISVSEFLVNAAIKEMGAQ